MRLSFIHNDYAFLGLVEVAARVALQSRRCGYRGIRKGLGPFVDFRLRVEDVLTTLLGILPCTISISFLVRATLPPAAIGPVPAFFTKQAV